MEEDKAWMESLAGLLPRSVDLHHVPVDLSTRDVSGVSRVLAGYPKRSFDVVVIDGHLRREVLPLALEALAPGGALVLDNAEGFGFHEELLDRPYARVDFFGHAPGVILPHCTSIVWQGECFLFAARHPFPTAYSR